MYIDGVNRLGSENTRYHTFPTNATSGIYIGDNIGLSYSPFSGNIDEFAIYTQDMADYVSEIYNSGTPANLTALSPTSWWRMGEKATFSTNWTVPDQIASNNGTSANMTIEDRVGDAPNSSNNSLSYNMDEADIVEDTPPN